MTIWLDNQSPEPTTAALSLVGVLDRCATSRCRWHVGLGGVGSAHRSVHRKALYEQSLD